MYSVQSNITPKEIALTLAMHILEIYFLKTLLFLGGILLECFASYHSAFVVSTVNNLSTELDVE